MWTLVGDFHRAANILACRSQGAELAEKYLWINFLSCPIL